jgi:dihydroorotate dehydrogenase (fumarate)
MLPLTIEPPLVNSANPWCTTLDQLRELYASPYTGAVTTRTSLITAFSHDEFKHQFTFYNPSTHKVSASTPNPARSDDKYETGSLNTLGYSPKPLSEYLGFIKTISDDLSKTQLEKWKPFIVSVTGTVDEVIECYRQICAHQRHVCMPLAMEVNLSCPNIPDKPPPAYSSTSLVSYLLALKVEAGKQPEKTRVPIGIKTPPYTYHDQYLQLIAALVTGTSEKQETDIGCPISFITATNTLGSSLLLTSHPESTYQPSLNSANGSGIGGLAGAPLHPLALGNVHTIKGMLSQHRELQKIQIIGVGGVDDVDGYHRMRSVGAAAVGVGTALGRKGVKVFEEIGEGLRKRSASESKL